MSRKYAIVDIETTGGAIRRDKIIEIAIAVYDGSTLVDEFQSLINPGRSISKHITMLTGITNEMLVGKPQFFEVARRVVEITQDCIFVAHNVRFDYTFIKKAFERLGYVYTRKQLCTVRMSRMIYPELRRHGLDALCKFHNITVTDRHRAMADVQATALIFQIMLSRQQSGEAINDIVNYGIKASRLPVAITLEQLHALPEECGVYYLHNENGDVIYVGKSINIKKRIMQHFADNTAKANKLQQRVHDITFELTGSELVALLLEEQEIKRLQPEVNRQLRRKLFPYALYYFRDEDGYLHVRAEKIKKSTPEGYSIIKAYPKLAYARGHLEAMIEEFELCQHRCGDKTGYGTCFNYRISKCYGACIGEEEVETYNERVLEAITYLQKTVKDSFFIIDQGREAEEKSVVMVEGGEVTGYGFVSEGTMISTAEALKEVVDPIIASRDAQRIVHWYLRENKMEKVIPF